VVGEVGRPHGVLGAVRVRPTGATLRGRAGGEPVTALLPSGREVTLTLLELAGEGDAPIARFAESTTRDEAGALRGALLVVPSADLPATEPDEFYVRDLIGCRVRVGDDDLGEVAEVHTLPANDVLEVRVPGGDTPVLIPFTRDAVTGLDVPGRRIVVRRDLLPRPGEPDAER
jgi:16S rRNA processing protein RimM